MRQPIRTELAAAACALLIGVMNCFPAAGAPPSTRVPFVPIDPYVQNRLMGRGMNLENLPHGANARYFRTIRDAGFTNVRLIVSNIQTSDARGRPWDSWFADLDTMLDAAIAEGLIVIIDENVSEACQADHVQCMSRLNVTWEAIASRYNDMPNNVLFEILNEPHKSFTREVWNAELRQTLTIIRATNPTRNVVIGSAYWNTPRALPDLQLPEDDRHIIVTIHYYEPDEFALQSDPRSDMRNVRNVSWNAATDPAHLQAQFDAVQSWSRQHHRPIFVGEFGVYKAAPEADRLSWISAVARGAEARGFSWAFFDFGPDFKVYDFDRQAWNESTLRVLIPSKLRRPADDRR